MMAYTVKMYSGHHDDGEYTSGSKLAQILEQRGAKDTAVFVSREYGGQQLGQCRFLHIEKAARDALEELVKLL